MREIIGLIAIAISSINIYSQATTYPELGALISDDSYNGSARYTAMGGAFGAIGGDISSVSTNPAGAAVGLYNQLSFTLGNKTTNTESFFSENKIEYNKSKNSKFDLYQGGASLVYDCNEHSKWERATLFFNYQVKNNFNTNFEIEVDHLKNPENPYLHAYFQVNPGNHNEKYEYIINQKFTKNLTGASSVMNIGLAGLTKDDLYLGTSLNLHRFHISETSRLNEESENEAGNKTLQAENIQAMSMEGNGVSMSFGAIKKIKQFRAGISFETPTLYSEILDYSNIYNQDDEANSNGNINHKDQENDGYTNIYISNADETDTEEYNTDDVELEDYYGFISPLKFTGSAAWIFGKKGLISIDYSYRYYSSMEFTSDSDYFNRDNKLITKDYANTKSLNIGTEWRFNKLKLRAGYEYKQNPYKLVKDNANVNSFSTGVGYSYKNLLFDLSYTRRNYNKNYSLYNHNDILNVNNLSRVLGTITFQL